MAAFNKTAYSVGHCDIAFACNTVCQLNYMQKTCDDPSSVQFLCDPLSDSQSQYFPLIVDNSWFRLPPHCNGHPTQSASLRQ
jgi:hypothetical protein